MEIFKAHRQWAARPEDERFQSLEFLVATCKAYAKAAVERSTPWKELRVEVVKDDVQLVGRTGVPATLSHWAFGQLCSRVEAPASYLRELPATLACQNLNHGLKLRGADEKAGDAQLMFHENGGLLLRSVTSELYSRIWNWEVADRLLNLEGAGWQPARSDFNVGSENPPALYASDHDMFVFLSNKQNRVAEPGNAEGLQRGIIVENSEVGARALKLTRFLYRAMCGNHIIWGASKVVDISIRHVGQAFEKFNTYAAEFRRYAEESVTDEEARIRSAKTKLLAKTKEELLDLLFGKRALGLSRKLLEAGYDAVVPDEDGSPLSVWGIAQGLTRHSQTNPYADQRTSIDRAAGKILEAF